MGKGTLKQRIRHHLLKLLNNSEPMALKYPESKMTFYKIESLAHFPLLHNDPLDSINFDNSIEQLKELVSTNTQDKKLQHYYLIVIKTNDLIKKLHKRKLKR